MTVEADRARCRNWRAANREKVKAYNAAYRAAHREEIRKYSTAYKKANKEKLNAASAAYAKAHTEKRNSYNASYRAKHKEYFKAFAVSYYARNKEKAKASAKAWYAANKEKAKATSSAYRIANRERRVEAARAWRAANNDRSKELTSFWKKRNPDKVKAQLAARRSRKFGQLHPKHDAKAELALCRLADSLTQSTGQNYHVDHIIPLACGGWHHHDNLQVLPAAENIRKKDNPFWELPGFKSWKDVPAELWPEKLASEYLNRLLHTSPEKQILPLAA